MGTEKRRRQKERRAEKRAERQRRVRNARRRALFRLWLTLTGLMLAATALLQVCSR